MRQAAEQPRYENTPRALGPYLLPAHNGKAPPPPPPGHRAVAIENLAMPGGVTIEFIGENDALPALAREVVVMNPPVKAANRLPVKAPPTAKAAPIPDARQPTMTTIGKSKQPFAERLGFNPDQVMNAFRAAQQMSAAMARDELMSEQDLFRIAYDSICGNNAANAEPEQPMEGGTASSSSGREDQSRQPSAPKRTPRWQRPPRWTRCEGSACSHCRLCTSTIPIRRLSGEQARTAL